MTNKANSQKIVNGMRVPSLTTYKKSALQIHTIADYLNSSSEPGFSGL